MNKRTPISYRPSINRGELEKLITKKLKYRAVNRFIDEAVKEKLNRELVVTSDPEMTRMIGKLTEVINEYKGWKFLKPSKEARARIRKKAEAIITGEVEPIRWEGSMDKTSEALRLTRPDTKTAAEIDQAVDKAKKTGQWIPDKELRPEANK